jgi:flagellar hook protein FlgE
MSLYGSLFAGVSGLQSQSNALGIISDNISNVNTVGYKGTNSLFQSLVTPNGSTTQYAPGGVIGGNRQLVTQQGLIQGTSSPTDIAISGSGFFVVSANPDGSGSTLYTRAGSFTQDSLGNFVNASGLYLKAWPLDRNGNLPGAPGNTLYTTSSADLNSLKVVNVKSSSGTASATTTVSLSLNLDAGEHVAAGAAQNVGMDIKDISNYGIAAKDIIVSNDYQAAPANTIARGDTMTITTTDSQGASQPHYYQYGGFTAGRSVTGVTPVTLGANKFSAVSGSPTVTVTMTDTSGLGPVGSTRYIDIEGATATGAFGTDKDVNGVRLVTITSATTFTYNASSNATATNAAFGGSAAALDLSNGDKGAGSDQTTMGEPYIQLAGAAFTPVSGSNQITVTLPGGGPQLGLIGSQRWVTIGGVTNTDVSGIFGPSSNAAEVNGARLVTITSGGFTFNADALATASTPFGTDFATVNGFTGNILDATSSTATFLGVSGTSLFTNAALTFTITSGGIAHTFTYKASSPSANSGQFNNLNNLAAAISATGDLTARVVQGRLYVSAVDANQAVTFQNGDAIGSNSSGTALGGIDWVGELDLKDVPLFTGSPTVGTARFNTMQGLADIVNNEPDMTATITNPSSASTLSINVSDPRGLIQMKDEDGSVSPLTNKGSLLAELGLVTSLNGTGYNTPGSTTTAGPKYDPTDSTKNMASGAITPQFSRNVTIYDSLGTAHNITTAYLKIGVNEWAVEVYDNVSGEINQQSGLVDGQIATGTVRFNGDGSLSSVSSGLSNVAAVSWTDQAQDSTITLNWGTAGPVGTGATDGVSQFDADYSLNFINQNGAPVGQLTSIAIDANGYVIATFTNGETQKLYKIPVADFNNADGLTSVSGNAFEQSNNSGAFNLREAGQNGVGTISPSSLESSNVELSDQLTQMIVAQRAYEANTKIITTVDALLQQLNQVIQ